MIDWISVEDGLPECINGRMQSAQVLAFNGNTFPAAFDYEAGNEGWFEMVEFQTLGRVTHWAHINTPEQKP